jgi:hypothetical protein
MEMQGVEIDEGVLGRKVRVFDLDESAGDCLTEGGTYEVIGWGVHGLQLCEGWQLFSNGSGYSSDNGCDWEWVEETPEVELPTSDLKYSAYHQKQLEMFSDDFVLSPEPLQTPPESSVEAPQQCAKVEAYERIKAAVEELNGAVRDAKGVSVDTVLSRSHKDSFITITSVTHQPATIVYNNGSKEEQCR